MIFFRFIKALVKFILKGGKIDQQEGDRRMKICQGCIEKKGNSCGICGCDLEWKTRMSTEFCPINKW
jgi:hypothetical protein